MRSVRSLIFARVGEKTPDMYCPFGVLFSFVIYATFRAFENKYYFAEPLVSPFYSPVYLVCGSATAQAGGDIQNAR